MLAPRLITTGPLCRTAERQPLHIRARRHPPGVVLVVACLLTTASAVAGTQVQSLEVSAAWSVACAEGMLVTGISGTALTPQASVQKLQVFGGLLQCCFAKHLQCTLCRPMHVVNSRIWGDSGVDKASALSEDVKVIQWRIVQVIMLHVSSNHRRLPLLYFAVRSAVEIGPYSSNRLLKQQLLRDRRATDSHIGSTPPQRSRSITCKLGCCYQPRSGTCDA
jgi:hypothetical protein